MRLCCAVFFLVKTGLIGMGFRFRFKSLLQKREYLLREAQSALAASQLRQEEIRRNLHSTREKHQDAWLEWQKQQQEGMEAGYFVIHAQYLRSLEHQLLHLESELLEAGKEVEKRQVAVLGRDKEVKVLQKLEEKERIFYKSVQLKKEQNQLNEIAVFKDFRCRSSWKEKEV